MRIDDMGFQLALVKDMLDPSEQRREIEEGIGAAEKRSILILENCPVSTPLIRSAQQVWALANGILSSHPPLVPTSYTDSLANH